MSKNKKNNKNKNRGKNNTAEARRRSAAIRSAYAQGKSQNVSSSDILSAVETIKSFSSSNKVFKSIMNRSDCGFFKVEGLVFAFRGESAQEFAQTFTEHEAIALWILVKPYYIEGGVQVVITNQDSSMIDWLTKTCSTTDFRSVSLRRAVKLLSLVDEICAVPESVAHRLIASAA